MWALSILADNAAADVRERDETEFRGALRIADANQFWASSRYLILVALAVQFVLEGVREARIL